MEYVYEQRLFLGELYGILPITINLQMLQSITTYQ